LRPRNKSSLLFVGLNTVQSLLITPEVMNFNLPISGREKTGFVLQISRGSKG